jgi:hypothetical protein
MWGEEDVGGRIMTAKCTSLAGPGSFGNSRSLKSAAMLWLKLPPQRVSQRHWELRKYGGGMLQGLSPGAVLGAPAP